MAIGSRLPGSAPIAGQFGTLDAGRRLVNLSQTVEYREIDPARRLATLSQSVAKVDPARRLVNIQQRVIDTTQPAPKPPAAYVIINGENVSRDTALNTVQVTFNEDQAATAAVFMFVEMGAAVNIPSFHGKSIRIETHTDPNDINSEIIPLFDGWIETARHDRQRMGIEFRATDLRDERLGREDGQALKQLTGGLYSNVTQREDVSGREYVTELMKTVSGSLGYTRPGDLRYHSWGVGSKAVDLTLTDADVSYSDLTTEFQTRSSVVNSVTVNMRYRWSALRSLYTEVDAYKGRTWEQNSSFIDYKAWLRGNLLPRIQGFSPWQTLGYSFYPLERVQAPSRLTFDIIVIDQLWSLRELWSQGFTANLVRHMAQPVTESYTFTVTAPQSVDAYGETVEGSELSFAAEVEYERNDWEQDFIECELADPEAAKAAEQAKADSRRADLADAFYAAYLIAKKEIVASHRNNYVEAKLHRIQPVEIGDIVQHNNRIVQTTGQCVGVEYTIADGVRDTSVRVAISYMDTAVPAPIENWSVPSAPTAPEGSTTLQTVVTYDTDDKAFDIKLPDISEQITDEYAPTIAPLSFDLPLEINPITLINGY